MKKKHILKGRYSTYAKNNKLSYFTFCLIVFLWIQSAVIAQTTVFTDDFGSSHTSLTSGGSPLMTYTAGSSTSPAGICDISSGLFRLYANATPLTGREYFMGALSTFNAPFNSTLHSNAGLLTWTFNMRTNRTSAMNGFDAGTTTYGAAVILVSNVADPTNSGANGYAVVLGKNVNATNTVKLVSFTGGLTANSKLTTIIGPSSDLANYTSYVSVKVVYTPTTDTWQLYYRDDTTTASVDPSSGTLTQVGSDVINTTYTSTAMSNFGFFYNHGTAANTANIAIFDNFKVRINAPVTYTSGWPKAENANSSGFTAKTKTNVAGTTYFVVLPNGAAAPSSTQVKNGQNQVGTSVASNEKGTIASTTGGTEYVSAVSGLSGNTTYDVYFVSEDASGSNLQSSPTLISISTTAAATAPLISSPTSAGITNTTATLGGQITSDGGSVITERGTIWNSTTGVLISDNKLAEGSTSTGIFTHGRTSLPPKTLVYYKAYATNNIGTSLTSEASFYTLANEPTTQATALSVSATSPTSVNLSWTAAVGVDGYIILQRLGSSATTDTPTDANMYSVGTAIGTGTVVANITSGLTTSQIISGLTANTNYTYKIFTVNSDGINSQTYNYFTTAAPSKTYIPSIINISTTTLSGYNYVAGSGPSVSQSYSINGTGLTGYPGNISITGSTNYEVSTDNSTFSGSVNVAYSSATLSATTIYVRLKAGLTAGSYNSESISNVGGGAFTTNVTCNGTVASAPITYIWQGADLADWQVSTNWNHTRRLFQRWNSLYPRYDSSRSRR